MTADTKYHDGGVNGLGVGQTVLAFDHAGSQRYRAIFDGRLIEISLQAPLERFAWEVSVDGKTILYAESFDRALKRVAAWVKGAVQ